MILKTRDGPLYFEITGDGPPLVFVSGWAESCECWRPSVALLGNKYRCLIYDTRGIGRSQPASESARFAFDDHVEDLRSILDQSRIYDAAIIGHEIGAGIAALIARRHPQHASSLIAVSPRSGPSREEAKKLSLFTPTSLALRELAEYPVLRNLIAWRFRRAPDPWRDRLYEDFAALDPRAAYHTAIAALDLDDSLRIEEIISTLEIPLLAVCGDRDRKGETQARLIFERAQRGKLATLKDCGFLPMLEYPRQFARLIRHFVATTETDLRSLIRLE